LSRPIFHLASSKDWQEAKHSGTYEFSTRGKTLEEVGFIHCSTLDQLPAVAAFVYKDFEDELTLLELSIESLEQAGLKVLFEDGGNGELFPHIYGPLPIELVAKVYPVGHLDNLKVVVDAI